MRARACVCVCVARVCRLVNRNHDCLRCMYLDINYDDNSLIDYIYNYVGAILVLVVI